MQVTTYNRKPKTTPRTYSSREEALARARNVAAALFNFGEKVYIRMQPYTYYLDMYCGVRASCDRGRFVRSGATLNDEISTDILARLIAVGETKLHALEQEVEEQIKRYPEIVAEARLAADGMKNNTITILEQVVRQKKEDLRKLFKGIPIPVDASISLRVHNILRSGDITLDLYGGAPRVTVNAYHIKDQINFLQQYDRILTTLNKLRRLFK